MKHSNLYLGLVLPSGGRQSLIDNFRKKKTVDNVYELKMPAFVTLALNPWLPWAGNTKGGKYHCTVDLLFDWFGISCITSDNFCFYLQNRLIQTGQIGGKLYSDFPL
jgi:hypothetical protein